MYNFFFLIFAIYNLLGFSCFKFDAMWTNFLFFIFFYGEETSDPLSTPGYSDDH